MKHHVLRLTRGTDLRQGIEDYCKAKNIKAGGIVTCVGSLYHASIRLADGETVRQYDARYEIVSLTGTVSSNGSHFHISIAGEDGTVFGGHVSYGCLVNTTAEIILLSLDDEYELSRKFDEETGYNELVICQKKTSAHL